MNENTALTLSFFKNKFDTEPKVREVLPSILTKHSIRSDKDGISYCPSIWHEGMKRGKAGISHLTAIPLDYDGVEADLNATLQRLDGIECIFHTTHSNQKGIEKFRVILPLPESVSPEIWPQIHQAAAELAGNAGLDPTCSELGRMYYAPSCPPEFADAARAGHQSGRRLTLAELLNADALHKVETTSPLNEIIHGVSEGDRNTALTKAAGSVIGKGMSFEEALQFCRTWNQQNDPQLGDAELVRTVKSIYDRHLQNKPEEIPTVVTDMKVAELFTREYRGRLRYWHESKKWLVFDNRRWSTETPGGAFPYLKVMIGNMHDAVRKIPDDTQRQNALKAIIPLEGHRRQVTLLDAAAVVPEMIVTSKQLDRNPMLLNCRNGTLDLKTGKISTHNPDDLITRLVDIDYIPEAQCPEFSRFLEKILEGKKELIDYLQRFIGYCLTGKTTEQVLLFLYGTGANGKTTLANIIEQLLGDFAAVADRSVLMHRDNRTSSNDIAALRGARLVKVSELNDGERLDEAAVKTMTGGDMVSCRFLYGEFFSYYPAYKILLLGNYKPNVRGRDLGIWRRIHLLPFKVAIPEPERDQKLFEKLTAELPGILAWAVNGSLEWQRVGLMPPAEVRKEIEAYRHSEDILSQWIEECCVLREGEKTKAADLHQSFVAFSNWRNITTTKFGRLLSEAGFTRVVSGKTYYQGISLKAGGL